MRNPTSKFQLTFWIEGTLDRLRKILPHKHPVNGGWKAQPAWMVSPLMRLLPVMWLAAMLAGLFFMKLTRRVPQRRRYAAAVSLALMLITGAVLAGCAGGKAGTPAGPAQLTITGASGTMSIPTAANSVTLTVQ